MAEIPFAENPANAAPGVADEAPSIAGCESAKELLSAKLEPSSVLPDSRGLRVVVLDEEVPYPPDSGKRIRTWNLLSRLARKHQICLLCYGNSENPGVAAAESAGIRVQLVPPPASLTNKNLYLRLLFNLLSAYPYSVDKHYSEAFESRLKELLANGKVDLVHCEWTPYAHFRGAARSCPFLVTAHNVESQIWYRRSEQSRGLMHRLFFRLQAVKMKRFEIGTLPSADVVTAATPEDQRLMQSWGVRSVRLVENGVDIQYFKQSAEVPGAPTLLFLGSLDWYPNLDALDYLLECIMPKVRLARPETRLQIVGRRPPRELVERIAGLAWAELAADVPDVRPWLAKSSIVVVPLRIGGGSRIKILEAFAAGRAVISTSVGAEGLRVVAGEHLEIADSPEGFADRIIRLLDSPRKCQDLGRKGRELAVMNYSWDRIANALESAWYETCGQVAPPESLLRLEES